MDSCVKLMQFAGFLLQTLPVAIMIGWPFEEEEFRVKKRNYYIFGSLLLVLAAAIFTAVYTWKDIRISKEIKGNIFMAIAILAYGVYFCCVVRTKLIKKMLMIGIGISYAAVIYLVTALIAFYLNGGPIHEYIYYKWNLIGLVLDTLCTYPLMYPYIMRIVKPNLQIVDSRMQGRQCAAVLIGLLLFCVESRAMIYGDFYVTVSGVAAIIGIVVVMYYMFFNEIRMIQEQYEMRRQMENFDRQSKSIGKNIEEMKRMHHNIHHHLNVIGVLNQEGKQKEIAEYLSRYEKIYAKLESQKLSGYMILDSVLRYYLQEMEEEKIRVQTNFQIGTDYDFEPIDITVLFGNCLENAIEEQRRLPVEERFVGMDIRVNGQFLMISMKNRCMAGTARRGEFADFSKFPSSKRSSGKGDGLRSIDIIAKKYKGNARFQRSESWFVMHVILQIP